MIDIKHMNRDNHKAYTTRDNTLIFENVKRLAQCGVELIVRVPVIPGFNDTEEEIREIASFVRSLNTVKEMHLLPYHRMGIDKYSGLGRGYTLEEILPPSATQMDRLLEVVNKQGLKGQIGG